MTKRLTHFAAGVLFAIGLAVGGMTQPQKILGFLDLFGAWDPSLLWVMVGAVGVHAIAYRIAFRQTRPLLAQQFHLPRRRDVDSRLMIGAALFGAGWGLVGYCPGPAIVSVGALIPDAFVVLLAIVAGFWLHGLVERRWKRAPTHDRLVDAEFGSSVVD